MLNGNSDGLTAKTVVSGKLYIDEEAEYLKSSGPSGSVTISRVSHA
jgi:hypothetical protein